jgi:ribonuclease Z
LAALRASDVPAQSIKVTLLGTGAPVPSVERFGPSTLIEAGDQTFLVDAGRGALQRLTQAGVRWRDVNMVITIGDSIDVRRPAR